MCQWEILLHLPLIQALWRYPVSATVLWFTQQKLQYNLTSVFNEVSRFPLDFFFWGD